MRALIVKKKERKLVSIGKEQNAEFALDLTISDCFKALLVPLFQITFFFQNNKKAPFLVFEIARVEYSGE